jgi:hypothetical protein
VVAAEDHVRSDLDLEATLVRGDAQRPTATWAAADNRAELRPVDLEGGCGHAMAVEAVEDDVLQRYHLDRVQLIGEPLRLEGEPASDDAVAGKAGEFDIHGARVDRWPSADHGPNVRRRPGPAHFICGRTHRLRRLSRAVRCGSERPSVVVLVNAAMTTLTRGA